ncbi:MAG TPA: biotin--[acetyl-CoA-carboxylase] ligase [Xanthomonadaceae bacterium]|nr:biotin--[acetyl-CoA-carboxylase] ligase [Xanthomonadaceae bacterium]
MSEQPAEAAALAAALGPLAQRIGSITYLHTVDSTNAELLRRGVTGDRAQVLIADAQSAGRGRLGRSWISPPGASLYLSLARRLRIDARQAPALTLVAGVACAEALSALGVDRIGLKWPNDLVIEARKLGGILVESATGGDGLAVVIGIGINLALPGEAAAAIDQPWTDLARVLGPAGPGRAAVAAAVLSLLLPALDEFERTGFSSFASRYAALDALRGRPVRLEDGRGGHTGLALGLAENGALRVRHEDGERRYLSGEVRVRASS